MKNKSNILIGILITAILFSVYFTYNRAFIDKNFEITNSEDISQ